MSDYLIHLTVTALSSGRVSPFGNPWIYACLRLPKAFRSLLRPSSAIGAMASALCSFLLDLSPFRSSLTRTALRPETFVDPFRSFGLDTRKFRFQFVFPCAVFKVLEGFVFRPIPQNDTVNDCI